MFRRILRFVPAALLAFVQPLSHAHAAAWQPARTVTLVVPFAAGGGTDSVARLVATRMASMLGQSVVVDNRPGANGAIAVQSVARQGADGHTLMLGSNSTHVIAPLASPRSTEAMAKIRSEFTAVSVLANAPLVLAVRGNTDRDLAAFLARARAAKLTYGTFGVGSSAHVMGETLAETAGIDLLHVPYKGSSPAMSDLLGGHVDSVFLTVAALAGQTDGQAVRMLAVTGAARVQSVPTVPTFEELGVKNMTNAGWFAVFAPARTPTPALERLASVLRAIVAEPEVRRKLVELGLEPVGSTLPQAGATWERSVQLAEPVVRRANIQLQ